MPGLGTIVNVSLILIGGTLGLLLKRFLSERLTSTIMQGMGLAVVIVGLSGALSAAFTVENGAVSSNHMLMMIVSLAIGGLAGEAAGIEEKLDMFAKKCELKFTKPGEASTFAQGFVTATLIFCVGAMAIVGSIEDGINKNPGILLSKSVMDGITSMVFASALGVGVLFSSLTVGLYQGSITLLALFIAPYLDGEVMSQMSLVGSVLILAIGLNMLKITKIKTGNLLPAILVPVVYFVIRRLVL